MDRLTVLVAVLALVFSGCAGERYAAGTGGSVIPSVSQQDGDTVEVADPPPTFGQRAGEAAVGAAEDAGDIACFVLGLPFSAISALQIMYAYDKAEREGGILP